MTARPEDTTLTALIADGFEKNECFGGWYPRQLPLRDEGAAALKYDAFRAELVRWKGSPLLDEEPSSGRRRAAWADIRIQQAGRGIMVWLRDGHVGEWWNDAEAWKDDPMQAARVWE